MSPIKAVSSNIYFTPYIYVQVTAEVDTEDRRIANICHWRFVSYYYRHAPNKRRAEFSSARVTSVMRLLESVRSINDPNISISLAPEVSVDLVRVAYYCFLDSSAQEICEQASMRASDTTVRVDQNSYYVFTTSFYSRSCNS
jgi:hypothetical protein